MVDPFHERLRRYPDVQSVLVCLLQRALEVCQTEFGNVQLMNWKAGYLEIKAQRGFQGEFLNFFEHVRLSHASACARALRNREPIIINDIMLDRSEEHTSELQSLRHLVCRLL